MKNITLILAIILSTTLSLLAQSVPQGMNYQAVARDMQGQVLADQDISLKISLLGDGAEGKVMYSEIHEVRTSSLGLFNVIIGKGAAGLGDFAEVSWGSVEVWMDIALDLNGDYVSLATTRLLTVPYAFHAGTAGEIKGGNSSEKGLSFYWRTNGNNNTTVIPHFLGTLNAKDLIFKTNNQERMRILSDGDLQMSSNNIKNLADPVDAKDAVTKSYVDGTLSAFSDHINLDNDLSPTNELNTGASLIGTKLRIMDAGGSQAVDLNSLEESVEVAAAQAAIDAHILADGDLDPTNELQDWGNLPGIPTDIANGDDVNDADADPTNEIQTLSQTGTDVTMSDGGGTISVADNDNDSSNELQDWTNLPNIPSGFADDTDDVDDADADPTNEIQTLSQTDTDVTLSDGGGTISVADNDNDSSNELQDWTNLPNIPSGFADDTDDVDDADADPTNEIQTLSQTGTDVTMSDGGGTISVADNDNDSNNEIELPTNASLGDIAFYNGNDWESIAPGTHGQTLSLCNGVPTWGPCPVILAIGDEYAGGIIFYLDESGEHGLVAALVDQSSGAQWGCYGNGIGGTSASVGSGQSNTTKILAGCNEAGIAARVCDDYSVTVGGIVYDDWFLPSKNELNLMYVNLHQNALGGFGGSGYWSSTENDYYSAWEQDFSFGGQYYNNKYSNARVRAVRAF